MPNRRSNSISAFVPVWHHLVLLCWCEKNKQKKNKLNVMSGTVLQLFSEPSEKRTQTILIRQPAVSHNRDDTHVITESRIWTRLSVCLVLFTGVQSSAAACLLLDFISVAPLGSLGWIGADVLFHSYWHEIWAVIMIVHRRFVLLRVWSGTKTKL